MPSVAAVGSKRSPKDIVVKFDEAPLTLSEVNGREPAVAGVENVICLSANCKTSSSVSSSLEANAFHVKFKVC